MHQRPSQSPRENAYPLLNRAPACIAPDREHSVFAASNHTMPLAYLQIIS